MAMAVGGSGGAISNINMTPMIDVLLVLIIIFMVITPLTPKGLEALVPQPPPPGTPPASDTRTVVIVINKDKTYMINQEPTTEATLGPRLEEIFKTRAEADAATDLLELARTADNPTDKSICLRGYLTLAGHADLAADKRLAMCREAAALVPKDEEKRLLLAPRGGIVPRDPLDLIKPYLDDPATKEEASTAAVDISAKLLQGTDSSKLDRKSTRLNSSH